MGGGGDVVMIKFYFGVDGVEVGNSNVVVVYVNDYVSWLPLSNLDPVLCDVICLWACKNLS